MLVKVTAEIYIDTDGLDPEFIDIEEFAKDEARRIMICEPDFYEFNYEIEKDEEESENEAT